MFQNKKCTLQTWNNWLIKICLYILDCTEKCSRPICSSQIFLNKTTKYVFIFGIYCFVYLELVWNQLLGAVSFVLRILSIKTLRYGLRITVKASYTIDCIHVIVKNNKWTDQSNLYMLFKGIVNNNNTVRALCELSEREGIPRDGLITVRQNSLSLIQHQCGARWCIEANRSIFNIRISGHEQRNGNNSWCFIATGALYPTDRFRPRVKRTPVPNASFWSFILDHRTWNYRNGRWTHP